MNSNTPLMLPWKIDGSIAPELARALNRFGHRRELAGRQPERVYFRPGEAPAQIPIQLNGLQIIEAEHIPVGGYFKLS